MRNVFEQLWYGNLDPYTECRKANSDTEELEKYIERHRKRLSETMTEPQKEVLEKLNDCYTELIDINGREIFAYAFKLGAEIAIGVLKDRNN